MTDCVKLVEEVRTAEANNVSNVKSYKNYEKKMEAWVKVSEEIGIPCNYNVFSNLFPATIACSCSRPIRHGSDIGLVGINNN